MASPDDLEICRRVLTELAGDPEAFAALPAGERSALIAAAKRLRKSYRRNDRIEQKAADARVLDATGIRSLRRAPVFRNLPPALPPPETAGELRVGRKCYVCKAEFTAVHHFYDSMCATCADLNWHKRNQTADLRGRVALVTGARVKIGYQIGLKLLRAGARVLVSTRFPDDAARRYGEEPDRAEWGDRLHLYGLDLRHTPSVERFCAEVLGSFDRLDAIVNNACQTVRRPSGFYAHLQAGERALAPYDPMFPAGQLDADLQQIDLRPMNSWRLPLAEVPTVELLEVQLVNAVAPFVLNARLKPLMLVDRTAPRWIVNVSAVEGQFYRAFKTDRHPHTNMAKAALNMMTRTSAQDYAKDGIYMNSVDTGWVTDEDPAAIAARKQEEHGFHPPLDIVDGAARVLDPILSGSTEHGLFYKDYRSVEW